jgi:hypothetical protein
MSIVINMPAGSRPAPVADSFEPFRHVDEFVIARIVEPVSEVETRYGMRPKVVVDLIGLDEKQADSVEYRNVIWWGAICKSLAGFDTGQIVAGRIKKVESNGKTFYTLQAPTAPEVELATTAVEAFWGN